MAQAHQRVFALIAALLFLGSSMAFSIFVIWQMKNNNGTDQSATSSIQDKLNTECQIGQDSGDVKPVPEAYKPEGDVTSLQTTDLQPGSGDPVKAGDCLLVKYNGTLAATGEKFDGNFDQPSVLRVPVGQGAVIPGWDQGLIGMKPGGVRRLVIPSDLAYGEQGTQGIPANADLVFVVELVKVEAK